MTHLAVIGAGQLGATLALLIDRWNRSRGYSIEITLIDSASQPLAGATRAAWINHATGLEYYNRTDEETGRACIQGAITKRLLLPSGCDQPGIKNRFFVSTQSAKGDDPSVETFGRRTREARDYYDSLRPYFCHLPPSDWKPKDIFIQEIEPDKYGGVANVDAAVESDGGAYNMAMDVALKRTALLDARKTIQERIFGYEVERLDESSGGVVIGVGGRTIKADYAICCAAEGNRMLARLARGSDGGGWYYMNLMLHLLLPRCAEEDVQKKLSVVNFVLKGIHGGMYACIVPPTADDEGLAALFAPGEQESYLHVCQDTELPTFWGALRSRPSSFGFQDRIPRILKRLFGLNPFLETYLRDHRDALSDEQIRPIVGTVFNPQKGGQDRSTRRLTPPHLNNPAIKRLMYASSPKWTTVELAALTALQFLLMEMHGAGAISSLLPPAEGTPGYGPMALDVPKIAEEISLRDVRISRFAALDYVLGLGLPARLVPDHHTLFEADGSAQSDRSLAPEMVTQRQQI